MSIDPTTGAISMLYGGDDYQESQWNDVTDSHAPAGSVFKAFTLVGFLESGLTWDTTVQAPASLVVQGVPVANYQHRSYSNVDIWSATGMSLNTAYVQYNAMISPRVTREVAVSMGIPSDTPGLDDSLTNALGTASPRPLDIAVAYSVLASGGVLRTPFVIETVLENDGERRYARAIEAGQRVIEVRVAAAATYAMTRTFAPGGTAEFAAVDFPAAGKTGTADGYRAAWFSGFTPEIATTVAMFQVGPEGQEESLTPFGGYDQISGASFPSQLWHDLMAEHLDGSAAAEFNFSYPGIPEEP